MSDNKKRLALILFGISYQEHLQHHTNAVYNVDFRKSIENYKKFIYKYFQDLNYEIGVFFATNVIEKKNIGEKLMDTYKPIRHKFMINNDNRYFSRNRKIREAVKCCIDSKLTYHHCLITRFDLIFKEPFVNLNFNKLNVVSILEHPMSICDNFYFMPYSLLFKFYNVLNKTIRMNSHHIKMFLEKISRIHYIHQERTMVKYLNFYKIKRG
jgi:hypothetical protein